MIHKAYIGSVRVVADSEGRVFDPLRGWYVPTERVVLEECSQPYTRWRDFPAAWCGYVPYYPVTRR